MSFNTKGIIEEDQIVRTLQAGRRTGKFQTESIAVAGISARRLAELRWPCFAC